MKRCKECGGWIDNQDQAGRESKDRPGVCVGCASHLDEIERGRPVAAVRTNESHNPADWSWS